MLENLSFGKLFASKLRTISILTILSLIIVLFTSSALAHNQINIVFGPKQYTRTTGKPDHFKDTFQAQQGKGKIFIKNGDIFQHDRHHNNHNVDSASISLNGKQIFSLSDFKNHRHFIIAHVNLKSGQNTIDVELKSKPGSYLTIEIIQIGTPPQPKPTVTISANPASIVSGAASTLIWTTANTDTCTIDNGIGEVSLNGSLSVNPTQTTTYTITATGPGGSATASTTITIVPVPTVTISAQPATITAGGTSTLSWISTNATTCSIDQGIGSVAVNGMRTVSPANTTKYTITATGPEGTVTASATVTVNIVSHIDITITSPADGYSLTGSSTMVTGTVNNSNDIETGVTVNGIVAALSNNQFAVNNVPLAAGQNIITVTATDTNGTTATKSITVNAAIATNYVKLSAYPESGMAPLEMTLRINGTFTINNPVITATGPGAVEQLVSTNPGEYTYQLNTEGIYYFTAQVTGPDNNVYQDTVAVTVLSTQVDALLRGKWEGMKTALNNQDINGAVLNFASDTQNNYSKLFTGLKPILSNVVAELYTSQVNLISIKNNKAIYEILVRRNGTTFSFQLIFIQDYNGIWRIWKY